ncbi:MAG TPA: porin [Gemmatimonadales bacterium]|nr:porin [Gemmatimonadales bacterium]
MSRSALGASLIATLAVAVATATPLLAQSPTVTISGVGYAQYLYQLKEDSSFSGNGHQNNFDVTRAYLNAVGKFPAGLTTRVTIDLDGRKAASNQLSIRLKYAYLAWTPEKSPLTFKLGEIHTPLLDWEEALWDYRMQGTMALERAGYVSSSDFGAGIDGNWGYDKVNMQVGVYNGENYSGAPGDQRKDLMGRVSVKLMNTDMAGRGGGLRVSAYAQYGKPTTGGRRERYLGMVSYKSKMLTLAGEIAATRDSVTGGTFSGTAVTPAANKTGRIYSVFGVLNVPQSKWGVIGRVDITDPQTGDATNDRLTRIIGGVSYQVNPNLRLLADVDNVSRQGGNYANGFNATRSTGYFQAQFTF